MFGTNLPEMPQELRRYVFDIASAIEVMDEPNGIVERITKFARLHGRTSPKIPQLRPQSPCRRLLPERAS
jgi:hypothetical protein